MPELDDLRSLENTTSAALSADGLVPVFDLRTNSTKSLRFSEFAQDATYTYPYTLLSYLSDGSTNGYDLSVLPVGWKKNDDDISFVYIGSKVTSIDSEAFADMSQLASVIIGPNVTAIRDGAFFNCVGLTGITIPSNIIELQDNAFSNCSSLELVHAYVSRGVLVGYTDTLAATADPLVIHARASDSSWTAGTGLTIGGNTNVTVIKDLADSPVPYELDLEALGTIAFPQELKAPFFEEVAIQYSDIDWRTATTFTKTLSANTTFTFSGVKNGRPINVFVTNTASNYTVTWPAGIKWKGGTTPTQTTGAKTDIYTLYRVAGVTYGSVSQDH